MQGSATSSQVQSSIITMASLSFLATTNSPFHNQKLHHSRKVVPSPTQRRFYAACCEKGESSANTTDTSKTQNAGASSPSLVRLDRRNVLLGGLGGGLYGATSLGLFQPQPVIGAPIQIPDLTKCHDATASDVGSVKCCPPYTEISKAIDYQFPSSSKPLRVRKPAQLFTNEEVAKYEEAVKLMKALPEDDPRSFMQQANVHCQYCNGAYYQAGTTDTVLQVHYSWFFLPWHRWYLHFYERILGSLIGDETFAIPYWNWDFPEGMQIPKIFTEDTTSPLYNSNRNLSHYPPAIINFKYSWGESPPTTQEEIDALVSQNLLQIYNAFTEGLSAPTLFMGGVLRAGETVKSMGSLEVIHNGAHLWVGPDEKPHMDMGNFYSAGRDSVFFCHHSNVDRMWQLYRNYRGNKVEFNDPDWLDSTFVFVDENKQLVKVKVSDSLSTIKLRYVYEDNELKWQDKGLRKKVQKATTKKRAALALVPVTEFGTKARELRTTIRALVSRPKTSRSKSEKTDAVEVLVISGIEVPSDEPSRFDVYVTTPYKDDLVGPDLGELAGSFLEIPHHVTTSDATHTHELKLGITNLLEDLNVESAEKLVVSLVPRFGTVTVVGVTVQLLSTDSSTSSA